MKQFTAGKGLVVLDYPPYSLDLSLADFFPLPHPKQDLKGEQFSSDPDIQRYVIISLGILDAILKEDFSGSFEELYSRCQKRIVKDTHYYEGIKVFSMILASIFVYEHIYRTLLAYFVVTGNLNPLVPVSVSI